MYGEYWYCLHCLAEYEDQELIRLPEPHGEVLVWSPCCFEAVAEYDELDTIDKERVDAKYL